MENANQLTCKASDRSEVGAFLHQNKKPTTRVGLWFSADLGGSWVFADGEDSRILRLESELSDLRMENANQLTCKASDRSECKAFLYQNKNPTTRVGFLFWWGKLDSDQRSQ